MCGCSRTRKAHHSSRTSRLTQGFEQWWKQADQRWILTVSDRIGAALVGLDQAHATAREISRVSPRGRSSRAVVARTDQSAVDYAVLASAVLAVGSLAVAAIGAGEPLPEELKQSVGDLSAALGRRRPEWRPRRRRRFDGRGAGHSQRRGSDACTEHASTGYRLACDTVPPPGTPQHRRAMKRAADARRAIRARNRKGPPWPASGAQRRLRRSWGCLGQRSRGGRGRSRSYGRHLLRSGPCRDGPSARQ
jgi:hypothetical protein